MKLFKIKKKDNVKYPYKIRYVDGSGIRVKVPSQYDFLDNEYIKNKGCIIAAFYMGLRFLGIKKNMKQCLKYLQQNQDKGNHKNYNLQQVCDSINTLASGTPATYYSKIKRKEMKKALKAGHMVLYTEKNPIHTAVLLWNGKKFKRFSNGKYKNVTIAWEIAKRCKDSWYKGCVVVERS